MLLIFKILSIIMCFLAGVFLIMYLKSEKEKNDESFDYVMLALNYKKLLCYLRAKKIDIEKILRSGK